MSCMHKRGLCRRAVSAVRPSVRPSITFVYFVETNEHIFKFFSPSVSHTIVVFPYQTLSQNSDGDPLTKASSAGGVGKNRDSPRISGFICVLSMMLLYMQPRQTVASWWHSSLVAVSGVVCWSRETDNEVFMTRSLNILQKLIVRICKSEAEVSNNLLSVFKLMSNSREKLPILSKNYRYFTIVTDTISIYLKNRYLKCRYDTDTDISISAI